MKKIKKFEAFSMSRENCDRCGKPTGGQTIQSMYNEDIICMNCKEEEKGRDDYDDAVKADNEEIKKGNYNFKGIGFNPKHSNENFDSNEFSENDLYIKISSDEFGDILCDNEVSFEKSESDSIQKLLNNTQPLGTLPLKKIIRSKVIIFRYSELNVIIRKFNDEWFFVQLDSQTPYKTAQHLGITRFIPEYDRNSINFASEYYKCDQLDGLLSLLKDKKIVK